MCKFFIINGAPTSGKSTFVSYCQEHTNSVKEFSTVDYVKEVALICGWDGVKRPKDRKFLSGLKDLLTEWNDAPFNYIVTAAKYHKRKKNSTAIFIHCREPEEIARLVEALNARTILVSRDAANSEQTTNHADKEVFNYNYDYIIENNGTLEDLREAAEHFMVFIEFMENDY